VIGELAAELLRCSDVILENGGVDLDHIKIAPAHEVRDIATGHRHRAAVTEDLRLVQLIQERGRLRLQRRLPGSRAPRRCPVLARALRLAPAFERRDRSRGPQTLTATAGRLLIATSPDAIMSNTANTNIKPLNPIGK